MLRTLALSAVAAVGLLLMPGPAVTTSNAAPAIAPRMATPESPVEQVRRGGGRHFHGGRGFRGHSFRGGSRRFYGGRGYGRSYAYYGGRHRHRGWRRGVIIGAGIPFLYGGGYYYGSGYYGGGCGYYYRKWQRTGSSYWRHRYYECRY